MHITAILSRIIIGISICTNAISAEYKIIVPFPPGSLTDSAIRHIQTSFERTTGDTLVIENVPGAETIIATQKFKNSNDIDAIVVSSGQIVFNPVLKNNLPYDDNDFDHEIYIGTAPGVWVTRPDTNIKTPSDLISKMPKFVGGYASSYNANLTALAHEKGVKSEIVSYKGSPDVAFAIMNGTIDLGVVAINSSLLELVTAGKLHIIGSTHKDDITVNNVFILSVPKHIGVSQFNGFAGVAFKPGMPADRAEALKKGLWVAINNPDTSAKLQKLFILPDSSKDKAQITKNYLTYRAKAK